MDKSNEDGAPTYGQTRHLEGEVEDGDTLVVIDDLITDGSTKVAALTAIREEATRRGIKLECRDVAVIMDRGQLGEQRLRQYGVRLHSLIPLRQSGLTWLEGKLSPLEIEMISEYLDDPAPFQRAEYRGEVERRVTDTPEVAASSEPGTAH